MAPKESDPLIIDESGKDYRKQFSVEQFSSDGFDDNSRTKVEVSSQRSTTNLSWPMFDNDEKKKRFWSIFPFVACSILAFLWLIYPNPNTPGSSTLGQATGPYRLVELQVGQRFFDYYNFYDGPDSIGSAGYNVYVGKQRAAQLNLAKVTRDEDRGGEEYIFMQSVAGQTKGDFRESVRLEGKRRFDRGLFILDVAHMPAGCGVWPAFWMTDEEAWPDNGEIDIVEGINTQDVAKTALHTSDSCSMYAQVPAWEKTGVWDSATGLPDRFTGIPNYNNTVEADNCWVKAPHQWGNQGCVAVSTENGTIGDGMNKIGGGVYVLEWDPVNGYIKSWVFQRGQIPDNLELAMHTASESKKENRVTPEPKSWPLPYAYFAIGERSSCSNDHFKNMRLVFNLAFCGAVAGNRFFKDCPILSGKFNVSGDSVLTCNAYIESEPEALSEAYWKIRGVYVYERDFESVLSSSKNESLSSSP